MLEFAHQSITIHKNSNFSDPTGVGNGGDSVWGLIEGHEKRFFEAEYLPKIRHSEPGLLSMVSLGDNMIGSQFFITLGSDQTSLDGVHCVIGQVVEGLEVLRLLNEAICDAGHRPYQDIRITHTVILEDPFENPRGFREPSRSPSPSAERLRGGRIAADEDIDDTSGKTEAEINEMLLEREAKARATILEIVGDLPDADIAPPENVLFVCKLNSITNDDDLEIIFSRFGKVKGCEVIRDRKSGDSLQYAFVEFEDRKSCEAAYLKMDNVLIDDRRIHVDFSQSVSKVQWRGKGRGLIIKDGSKNNRLDFANYKDPVKREGGNRDSENSNRQRYQKSNDTNRRYDDNNRRNASPRRDTRNFGRRFSPPSRDRRRTPDRSNRRRSRSKSPLRRQRSRSPRDRQHRSRSPRQRQQRSRSPRRHDRNEIDRNRRQTDVRSERRPQSRSRDNIRRSSPVERSRDNKPSKRDSPIDSNKKARRRRSSSSGGRSHGKDKGSAKKSKKLKKSSKKSKKKNAKKHKKRSSSTSSSSSSSDTSSSSSS